MEVLVFYLMGCTRKLNNWIMDLRNYFFDDSNYIYSYRSILSYIYNMKYISIFLLVIISALGYNLIYNYTGT